ncbi:hypothetical protein [Roseovarius sp.]|nr:hypothetical protein [Roseovarius sp.]
MIALMLVSGRYIRDHEFVKRGLADWPVLPQGRLTTSLPPKGGCFSL